MTPGVSKTVAILIHTLIHILSVPYYGDKLTLRRLGQYYLLGHLSFTWLILLSDSAYVFEHIFQDAE